MKVRYKREMRHNYMILEALKEDRESYEFKMLEENTIDGLLRFRVKHEEEGLYYYYEITSKQPLSRLLGFKEIKKEELSKLIVGIGNALEHMEDHLLQESDLLLEPEHIYIEPESYQVWLCYVPGYHGDLPSAMGKLLQFLLKKADHKDDPTVMLAYRLYQESQKDHYGMSDLLKAVREIREDERGSSLKSLLQRTEMVEAVKDPFDIRLPAVKRTEKNGREETVDDDKDEDPISGDGEGKTDIYAKSRENSRQWTVFVVLSIISFFVVVPAAVWLFAGTAGLLRYKLYIVAADVAASAGALILIRVLKAGAAYPAGGSDRRQRGDMGLQKEREELQAKWYMRFAGDEDGEGEDKAAGDMDGPEPAYCSIRAEGTAGKDTVLLAEAAVPQERTHLLKSLDPSVEDIPVSYFPFIIGKQEGIVDYILKKDTVSRLHLRLDEEGGECKVTDLNSSNGTVVAGHDLEANGSCRICSGDKLQIADLSFVFY